MSPSLHLSGYSTALFSTWYFASEYGVLFDCGDGVCNALLQKSRKIKHIFISHADRDHLTGLLQLLQLNSRPELHVYYPKNCGSFPALAEFCSRFDAHTVSTQWTGLEPEQEVAIRGDLVVRSMENRHVPTDGSKIKSLSYVVQQVSRKLKPELMGRPGEEIGRLKRELGDDAVTDPKRQTQLIYSGDTPIENDGRYNDTDILIHEATFLTAAEIDPDNPRRNKHSSLDQVMKMVSETKVQTLVLGHFSSRYSDEQIDEAIEKEAAAHHVTIPIKRLYPGQTTMDILGSQTKS